MIWGAAILAMAPRYIWWMMPILSGLILSVPLTMFTSRASVGRWMRRRGLLLTPEETNTPAELVALEERMAGGVTAVEAQTSRVPIAAVSDADNGCTDTCGDVRAGHSICSRCDDGPRHHQAW